MIISFSSTLLFLPNLLLSAPTPSFDSAVDGFDEGLQGFVDSSVGVVSDIPGTAEHIGYGITHPSEMIDSAVSAVENGCNDTDKCIGKLLFVGASSAATAGAGSLVIGAGAAEGVVGAVNVASNIPTVATIDGISRDAERISHGEKGSSDISDAASLGLAFL